MFTYTFEREIIATSTVTVAASSPEEARALMRALDDRLMRNEVAHMTTDGSHDVGEGQRHYTHRVSISPVERIHTRCLCGKRHHVPADESYTCDRCKRVMVALTLV